MNRVLVALSAVCLPMLSVAAPPITGPVDVKVTNPVLPVEVSNADPILTRSVDESAVQLFRVSTALPITTLNSQKLLTTVPAGKRLVVESISWFGFAPVGTEIVFAGLRSAQFGTHQAYLQINAPHAAASGGFVVQDGFQSGPVYFESGEEVWLSASKSNGATGVEIDVILQGHFVTL